MLPDSGIQAVSPTANEHTISSVRRSDLSTVEVDVSIIVYTIEHEVIMLSFHNIKIKIGLICPRSIEDAIVNRIVINLIEASLPTMC